MARKWERRRAARKDRITKQKGIREAELDQMKDVIPVREVPLWYALKVNIIGWLGGMAVLRWWCLARFGSVRL